MADKTLVSLQFPGLNDTYVIPQTAADVGAIAAPASPTADQYLKFNGTAWVASALPTYNGGVS